MSVMGFPKKSLDGWVGGWGELYPIFCDFFNFENPLSFAVVDFIL